MITQTTPDCSLCGEYDLCPIWNAETWHVSQYCTCGLVFQP